MSIPPLLPSSQPSLPRLPPLAISPSPTSPPPSPTRNRPSIPYRYPQIIICLLAQARSDHPCPTATLLSSPLLVLNLPPPKLLAPSNLLSNRPPLPRSMYLTNMAKLLIQFPSCLPRQNGKVFLENCSIAVVKSDRLETGVVRALRAAAMRVNLPPLSTVKLVASPVVRHRRPTPAMPVARVFILPRTSLELD